MMITLAKNALGFDIIQHMYKHVLLAYNIQVFVNV